MPVKGSPERNGRTLIEQDPHIASRRNSKALTRVLEDGINLVAGYPWEPRQEIRNRCAAFEILEERAHRNARGPKQPFSADLSGDAFDGGALVPIEHT